MLALMSCLSTSSCEEALLVQLRTFTMAENESLGCHCHRFELCTSLVASSDEQWWPETWKGAGGESEGSGFGKRAWRWVDILTLEVLRCEWSSHAGWVLFRSGESGEAHSGITISFMHGSMHRCGQWSHRVCASTTVRIRPKVDRWGRYS